jgi:hypothetical protein
MLIYRTPTFTSTDLETEFHPQGATTMNSLNNTLQAAEMNADRASVQELRVRMFDVIALRSSLDSDGLDYANMLLMKLSRLINEQTVAFA